MAVLCAWWLSSVASAAELPDPEPRSQQWRVVPQAIGGFAVGAGTLMGGVVIGFAAADCSFFGGCDWSNTAQGAYTAGVVITAVPVASAAVVHAFAPRDRRRAPVFLRTWAGAALGAAVPAGLLLVSGPMYDNPDAPGPALQSVGMFGALLLPTAGAMVASWTAAEEVRMAVVPRRHGGVELALTGRF